jgi:hypothetical protein
MKYFEKFERTVFKEGKILFDCKFITILDLNAIKLPKS